MSGSSSETVLVLVCGLPAAGKTTLVKHLEASSSTPSRLYERISLDDLYGQQVVDSAGSEPVEFDPGTWKASQRDMVERVSKRLEEHNASARSNGTTLQLVLLVDDIFQYRSLRKRFFHLATQLNCGFGLLYVKVPAATCRARNAGRSEDGNGGARVPDAVFERMVTVFEAPNDHQNPWEVNTCELNETEGVPNIEEVMDALIQQAGHELKEGCLLQLEKQRGEAQQRRDRLSMQQNVLHLVDLQLRQWISTQLQDDGTLPPGMTKAQFASQLNRRRKSYLASIKHSHNNIADRLQGGCIEEEVVSLVLGFQHQE